MLRSKPQRWIPELRFGYPPLRKFPKYFWEKLGIFLESLGGSQRQLCIKTRPLGKENLRALRGFMLLLGAELKPNSNQHDKAHKTSRENRSGGFAERKTRVFLNPWFGEPVVCTLDSHGFRHFRDFRKFQHSTLCL